MATSFQLRATPLPPTVRKRTRRASRRSNTTNGERAMRRFYEAFSVEHEEFLRQVEGIADADEREAYVSHLLRRLMFVCFIQQRRLLDDDPQYLRHRFHLFCRRTDAGTARRPQGAQPHASFYRGFLLRLFHEGLGARRRTPELARLLGRVPCLDGGLFHPHPLERGDSPVEITNAAFARLFDFFDRYTWQASARAACDEHEIAADVLGYICERRISRKSLGAYFTKEDITDYIAANSILPSLFDRALVRHPEAFDAGASVWRLLAAHPDRYIYDDVRRGVIDERGEVVALPEEIAAGVDDVRERAGWDAPAATEVALAGETWREYVARRRRCLELRERMRAGEFVSVNQLITDNLNLGRFALDVLSTSESAELIEAFYSAITGDAPGSSGRKSAHAISILDPTCGSGAFLFAALRILEPLVAACLRRMDELVSSAGGLQEQNARASFRRVLEESGRAPSLRYFIRRTIITRNLYGVDITEEAAETCRMRLLLELVGAREDAGGRAKRLAPEKIERLPSLASNIRAGNALSGFATQAEARRATGREPAQARAFHWFAEFPRVARRGGFDTIIGNPPYVEYSRARQSYRLAENLYRTERAGNLYAFTVERALKLLSPRGSLSMILPLSAFSTRRMKPLVELVRRRAGAKWISHFGWRPAKLFEGVNIPLSILLLRPAHAARTYTTAFNKWYSEFRPSLFPTLQYTEADEAQHFEHSIPKLGSPLESRILTKLFDKKKSLQWYQSRGREAQARLFYRNTGGLYWRIFTDFQPFFEHDGRAASSSTEAFISFRDAETLALATGILNSNLYWFFYVVCSSFHHVNPCDILEFPVDFEEMDATLRSDLRRASAELMDEMKRRSRVRRRIHQGGRTSRMQTFYPSHTKPLNDRIDRLLGRVYNLTDEELDYVVSYDIKYRARDETRR